MAIKERYQNPVVGDTVKLRLFAYNSNARTDFKSVEKIEIYFLDPNSVTETNPEGRVLVDTITDGITNVEVGQYMVAVPLPGPKYVIGNYRDVWYVTINDADSTQAVLDKNLFEIYPDLWFTCPVPTLYDFDFAFRPNKIRQGSKRYIAIQITPNVPKADDIQRYYMNLAIVSPIRISIEQNCGDCVPQQADLRLVVDNETVELREKNAGYYFLDTTEMDCGIYDVWFELDYGESTFVSDKQQLQIF